jgi:hypothetical protein
MSILREAISSRDQLMIVMVVQQLPWREHCAAALLPVRTGTSCLPLTIPHWGHSFLYTGTIHNGNGTKREENGEAMGKPEGRMSL